MVFKKTISLLLTASVVTCMSAGIFSAQTAHAITKVDELADIDDSNWAFTALKELVEKYNILEGYPDKTFRGERKATRYELAAALDATMKAVGKEIARRGMLNKDDLAKLAKLQQELAPEVAALQARTAALEARADKIEAKNDEQDNRLAVLDKMHAYGDASIGGYSDISGGGMSDAISAVGRTRLNFDYDVVDDKENSIVGPGTIHTRLVAAFGRVSPLNSDGSLLRSRYTGASLIAGDSSAFNEGIRTNDFNRISQSGNVRLNAYIDSASYSQVFKGQLSGLPQDQSWRTSLTTHAGLIPWRDIYFQSPYQGNENIQFQNTGLINNPAILTNFNVPRLAAVINQGLGKYANFQLKTDVSSLDVANAANGIGFTTEADLGYNLGFLNENLSNLSGNLFGGYYLVKSSGGGENNLINVTRFFTDGAIPVGSIGDSAQGFYAGVNQRLYKGIGLFGSYALNDTGPVSSLLSSLQTGTGTNVMFRETIGDLVYGIKDALVLGTEIPISAIPGINIRQRDAIGFAWSRLTPNTAIGSPANGTGGLFTTNPAARDTENVMEGYYRLQINDNFALIPSTQIILNRMGFDPNHANIIIGLRSSFQF